MSGAAAFPGRRFNKKPRTTGRPPSYSPIVFFALVRLLITKSWYKGYFSRVQMRSACSYAATALSRFASLSRTSANPWEAMARFRERVYELGIQMRGFHDFGCALQDPCAPRVEAVPLT